MVDETGVDFSFIVPLHRDGPQFRACLKEYERLVPAAPFEVIVVSDAHVPDLPPSIVRVTTGSPVDTSPAVKRDAAAKVARGRFLAYIDDDAYPAENWLSRAFAAFGDPDVQAVGGPGLTPPGSPWRQRLGGAVYESRLGSGPLRHRFLPVQPSRDADDLPAYNFVVRREAIEGIGGWNSTYYGGEDTKVCLELIESGARLRYIPEMAVYHYRRSVLMPHLRQVANVARHRGFFVRKHPATSRRLVYFLPAMAVLAAPPLTAIAAVAFARRPRRTLAIGALVWGALSATAYRRTGPAAVAFPAVLASHHLAYGANFCRGLLGGEITT